MLPKESRFAGFSTRLLAHNIDLIPILILLYGVSFIVPNEGYDLFLFSGIYLLYYIGFELSPWRGTPGKKWMKIKVTSIDQGKANAGKLIIRNLSKFISLILLFGGFIMITFSKRKQGLHDFIGGTLVLFDED